MVPLNAPTKARAVGSTRENVRSPVTLDIVACSSRRMIACWPADTDGRRAGAASAVDGSRANVGEREEKQPRERSVGLREPALRGVNASGVQIPTGEGETDAAGHLEDGRGADIARHRQRRRRLRQIDRADAILTRRPRRASGAPAGERSHTQHEHDETASDHDSTTQGHDGPAPPSISPNVCELSCPSLCPDSAPEDGSPSTFWARPLMDSTGRGSTTRAAYTRPATLT